MNRDTVNKWLQLSGEKPAVVFGDRSLSYDELDAYTNRVANHLIQQGVRCGDPVGICLDRSVEMVVVLVSILKAGAAYVPLDPTYPSERLAMMEEDARLSVLVAYSGHAHLFKKVLVWEEIAAAVDGQSAEPPECAIDPEHAAYIIFTSGSTGRPKGIEMPHRALANLIEWQLERKSFKPQARVLQYSSISFDVSFQEIATTLASGGTLFLIANEDRKDPRLLLGQLKEQGIERLFLPYVAMRSLIEAAHTTGVYPEELNEIITAGEQLRIDDVVRDFFARNPAATLDNQYGPSETHVITAQLLDGDPAQWPDLPGIGTPLKNCAAFILDEQLEPVPAGEEGELFLAGRNLALGYIGREELTRQAFVPAPESISDYSILYKTGDLAACFPDGSIEFLGRRDHQIKIRGHRIEPGEINNAASAFSNLGQCLTHAFRGEDGMLQLATYYTVKGEVDIAELRDHLASKLPEYMVPAFLIKLTEIPYTPSGKVNLKALPKPSIDSSRFAGELISYESETEEELSKLWKNLLGLDGIPRMADFFELGGDSLRAATLFLNIEQRFGCDLPLSTLLQAPTLETLAQYIEDAKEDGFPGCRSLKQIQPGADGVVPLFLVHGGAGNVLCFSTVARNMGSDQPVYAFQWSGWDGGRGESSISEMARVYCDELLKTFPGTAVRIGGYCIGGLIAIELAKLLREAGVNVLDPVVAFDSPNLKSKTYHSKNPEGEAGYKKVCLALADKKICDDAVASTEPLPLPLPWLKQMPVYAFARYLRTLWRLHKTAKGALGDRVVPYGERNWYCAQTQVMAAKRFRSSGYDGYVLYFRSECTAVEMLLSGWWSGLYMGFDELCSGGFEAYVIG
ncbi:MAG: amino acid adenylation domain-containing protein, partial [Kiritimatiellaceae bacterium]|nr:amino acid adenylation domain-containing protein [Kiritimatiellaceae bacterium]